MCQVCGNIDFVDQGLLRSFYTLGEKEITSGFFREGDICFSHKSFFCKRNGNENIQAVEAGTLWYLTHGELDKIFTDYPEFNFIARVLLQQCLMSEKERVAGMWMHGAEERYRWFAEKFPDIVRRMPAKHIASYIEITEGLLSTIKARR